MFNILGEYKIRLNPSKCACHVSIGKFLSFIVNTKGIKANLDKVIAKLDMKAPKTLKKVQSLKNRLAMLNHFISKAIKKCLPFFKVLKKAAKFNRTQKYEKAFSQLKGHLS